MSRMSRSGREEFLSGVHVGVVSVEDPGHGPLTVPVWYSYEPGGLVNFITGSVSKKATLIDRAGRFSICAQMEEAPYRYVSVEGPVAERQAPASGDERRGMAHRYLGEEFGDLYVSATEEEASNSVVFRMRPESWRTGDFSE
jgi:nitroimidazol reductase NimA-like FMN-containing flavoprotein (pyridoxamine 5'-phosphate oxidase superfamily)